MSLWNRARSLVLGVDLDQVQRDMDASDRRLEELNRQALEHDRWNQEQFEQAEANRLDSIIHDPHGQVREAFREGWQDGAQSMRDRASSITGAALRILPWQIWLGLAVVAVIYLLPILWRR